MTKDEALKMAIKILSQDEGWFEPEETINACKEALEQPTTQEPVGITYRTCAGYIETEFNKEVPVGTSLYTHPKQWQGITKHEIIAIDNASNDLHEFAFAIEAKLKEKNT